MGEGGRSGTASSRRRGGMDSANDLLVPRAWVRCLGERLLPHEVRRRGASIYAKPNREVSKSEGEGKAGRPTNVGDRKKKIFAWHDGDRAGWLPSTPRSSTACVRLVACLPPACQENLERYPPDGRCLVPPLGTSLACLASSPLLAVACPRFSAPFHPACLLMTRESYSLSRSRSRYPALAGWGS